MPRFDFRCAKCGHTEERHVTFAQVDTPQVCGQCLSEMDRLPHYSGVIVGIPIAFMAGDSGMYPQNEDEKRRWDEDGIGARWT